MFENIFDEQYPGLGTQIAGSYQAPTTSGEPKWWELLLQQVPGIIGAATNGGQINTQLPATPPETPAQSIFTTSNMITAGLVLIAIMVAWKVINKL